MKKITIFTACYNEEENVEELYKTVKMVMAKNLSHYQYEHLFIDNASEDKTVSILKKLAKKDKNVKIIVNSRNFGHVRSPSYGMLQADGDAVISLVADFQDPPELIPELVKKWENNADTVLAIKSSSKENRFLYKLRCLYYKILASFSDTKIFENFTGFGLYDKKVIKALREMNDPYPFFRGMIAEAGYNIESIEYKQPKRKHGYSKNHFYSLYDMAILGIISNSKIPLRLAIFTGFICAILSALTGLVYFIAKLLFWEKISLGIAPLLIISTFMFSIILFFIGIIGEYIGAIYTQVLNRPLVHEKERINFKNNSKL